MGCGDKVGTQGQGGVWEQSGDMGTKWGHEDQKEIWGHRLKEGTWEQNEAWGQNGDMGTRRGRLSVRPQLRDAHEGV